jgi:hypothetical protein
MKLSVDSMEILLSTIYITNLTKLSVSSRAAFLDQLMLIFDYVKSHANMVNCNDVFHMKLLSFLHIRLTLKCIDVFQGKQSLYDLGFMTSD